MATYKVLYWQDIPSLIEAEDAGEMAKVPMGAEFEELIDAKAMEQGLIGSDAYLDHFRYGDEVEREGSAQEVADAVKKELQSQFNS